MVFYLFKNCLTIKKIVYRVILKSKSLTFWYFTFIEILNYFEIPEFIEIIERGTFKGCLNLQGNISIPEKVNMIKDEAFSGCSGF